MAQRFSEENFEKLERRIAQLLETRQVADRSFALIYLLLRHRFLVERTTVDECITDGANDCGIDAVYIDHSGDDPVVHLVQSKVFESSERAAKAFPANALEKVVRFLEILQDRRLPLEKVASPRLEQKILEIRELVDYQFPSFRVWLVSNGLHATPHELAPLAGNLERRSVLVEEFHLDDIVEFCIETHSRKTNHTFFARDVGVLEANTPELKSIIGYISAGELFRLLGDLRDQNKIDYSIFDMNVRGFLGMGGSINREIFKSATSSTNERFLALNNGITIIGSQCRVSRTGTDAPRIGIKRMSIVNGAQTCSAIFDALRQYPDNNDKFARLSVLFRVFETENPDLISAISVSTNNQNRINPRDLKANDELQRNLEAKLAKRDIVYHRRRGAFSDEEQIGGNNTELRELDSLRAGQIILSYLHLDPVKAKRDSDHIFSELYSKVFNNVDVERLIEGLNWLELIEARREFIADEVRIRGSYRVDDAFIPYGMYHILMLCALLGRGAPDQNAEQIIDEALDRIRRLLQSTGSPAYYSFFRDPRIAEQLRNEISQPRLI